MFSDMRNKTASQLQKTYDECYLICSTAVYFESQSNEAEALRSWRSALDQIYWYNAKAPVDFKPRTETEKALRDSLRDMERQCKERVDLLEALRRSREEAETETSSKESKDARSSDDSKKDTKERTKKSKNSSSSLLSAFKRPSVGASRPSTESETTQKGFIGDGTIPALNYPDLSRPSVPTAANVSSDPSYRPPVPPRNLSNVAVVGRNASLTSLSAASPTALRAARGSSDPSLGSDPSTYLNPSRNDSAISAMSGGSGSKLDISDPYSAAARSPSPRRKERSMLTTLRFSGSKKPSQKKTETLKKTTAIGEPNQAATLAWNAIQNRGKASASTPPLELAASAAAIGGRSGGINSPIDRPSSENERVYYDKYTRRLVTGQNTHDAATHSGYPFPRTSLDNAHQSDASTVTGPTVLRPTLTEPSKSFTSSDPESSSRAPKRAPPPIPSQKLEPASYPTYLNEYPDTTARTKKANLQSQSMLPLRGRESPSRQRDKERVSYIKKKEVKGSSSSGPKSSGLDSGSNSADEAVKPRRRVKRVPRKEKEPEDAILADVDEQKANESDQSEGTMEQEAWKLRCKQILKRLPKGTDENAAKQILNEIVVKGDEVHWDDVAGLEVAKSALKEAVVYPFLRPDLFKGLREPARGMLLFGPPGTGKTMLARACATESRSTFFSISASSLTSKYLGESEKLVRALFQLARTLAPSIIFVDEIDSLLSTRSGQGEHEATRRIKTEFLIQWSDLQRAAAGREPEKEKQGGDPTRVLVLAATNMPWAIDDAARRRFVRRQYIPLPEAETRKVQLMNLLSHQKHSLTDEEIDHLVELTDGYSGSDITALAKDAAMGPLRTLGEALLHMEMDQIRPIGMEDFGASLINIRPSVSKAGLLEYEAWAKEFGERGG